MAGAVGKGTVLGHLDPITHGAVEIDYDNTASGITATEVQAAIDEIITGTDVLDHGLLDGRSDDDHLQYALLAGRSGGQALIGGTDASDNLDLFSTSDATKGLVRFGGLEWDEDGRILDFSTSINNVFFIKSGGRNALNWFQSSSDQVQLTFATKIANPTQGCQFQISHDNSFLNIHGGSSVGSNIFLYGRDHTAKLRAGFVWIEPSNHANAAADGKSNVVVNLSNTNSRFEIRDSETRRIFVNKTGDLFFDDGSFNGGITKTTLTADRTYTLPDISGTFILGGTESNSVNILMTTNREIQFRTNAHSIGSLATDNIRIDSNGTTLDIGAGRFSFSSDSILLFNSGSGGTLEFLFNPLASNDQVIILPDNSGTVALTTQLDGSMPLSEVLAYGENSGANDLIMDDDRLLKFGNNTDQAWITFNSATSFLDFDSLTNAEKANFIMPLRVGAAGEQDSSQFGPDPVILSLNNQRDALGVITQATGTESTLHRGLVVWAEGVAAATGDFRVVGLNSFAHTEVGCVANLTSTTGNGGMSGGRYVIRHRGTGTVTSATGISVAVNNANNIASTGTITQFFGVCVEGTDPGNNSTTDDFAGFYMADIGSVLHTMTDYTGLLIENLTTGTNNYGIVLNGTNADGGAIHLGGKTTTAKVYSSAANILNLEGASKVIVSSGTLQNNNGRIVKTTRITANTTLDTTHHNIFCDTDGGAFTVTLPAGVAGTKYRIINTGTSGNAVTITPDVAELLLGENSNWTLLDGDVLTIVYETTEGWW